MKKLSYSKYKSKIGYCDNKDLPGLRHLDGGHYVYIRNRYNDKCSVNIVTSLEDEKGNFKLNRIKEIKKGNIYPLPKKDTNFTRWSGINHSIVHNVDISKVKNVNKKRIKKRHNFFINKFMK